jgi:hypothetical protein
MVNPSGGSGAVETIKQRHDLMTLGVNYKFD